MHKLFAEACPTSKPLAIIRRALNTISIIHNYPWLNQEVHVGSCILLTLWHNVVQGCSNNKMESTSQTIRWNTCYPTYCITGCLANHVQDNTLIKFTFNRAVNGLQLMSHDNKHASNPVTFNIEQDHRGKHFELNTSEWYNSSIFPLVFSSLSQDQLKMVCSTSSNIQVKV